MVTKLTALLCVLAVGTGLSAASAQQPPTENKGVKTEPYRATRLASRDWTTLHSVSFASGKSLLNRAELPPFTATKIVLR